MPNQSVRSFLDEYDGHPPRVRMVYVDLTAGETTASYYVEGAREVFSSIHEFTAEALIAIEQHMTGDSMTPYPPAAWSELEVASCEPASWMTAQNPTVRPGTMHCFPAPQTLGFQPPTDLERKLFILPRFSGIEECLATQNAELYVLLYWYTTG
jgi:hypothetical protein